MARILGTALLILLATPALAAPRIASFRCTIGDGRAILASRAEEDESDDELDCRVTVSDLSGRSPGDLAAELRIVPARGPFRAVATTTLVSDGSRARTEEMFISHSTWASAIDWRSRGGPRLHLLLCILDRPGRTEKSWRIVASAKLDVGAPISRKPTR